ncbi:MAG: HEAT repeat domain-containing protein [Myxococcales bacterium]|nr:HEAT repeat domain-containing protein [Myxococcales bacterium]MCB9545902.1 HEAT repeat domain-containing protein [Myxococcales bacterium]
MRTLAIAALALAGLWGCGDKTTTPAAGEKAAAGSAAPVSALGTPASGAAAKLSPDLAGKVANAAQQIKGAKAIAGALEDGKAAAEALADGGGEGVSPEQLEKLLLDLATCKVDDAGIERDCEANKAWRDARKNRGTLIKDWSGLMAGLGQKHIKNASPAVRIQAASLMGSIFGASGDSQSTIIDAAKVESDPQVLKAMLRAVASSIKKNDAVRQLALSQAGHADAKIRMEVLSALTSSWAKDTEGTLEKAMEMTEKDESPEVRIYACRRLGERADERALPLLLKLTADHKADPKLYSACVRGLIAMWSAPVPHKTPSEKAYQATLAILKKKPRDEAAPPWTAISAVEWASKDRFQQAAPWYKKGDLIGALADLTADRQANWLARTAALDAMKRLGAENGDFEKLKAAYNDVKDKPGTDKHVFDKIEKLLAGK